MSIPSPITYFGGKSRLAEQIVELFPPHRHYVEVCGGSLAVLLAKPPSAQETVNDLNKSLMTFWRMVRDRPEDLERACSLTPHSRAERELAWSIADDLDELEIARRVFVALTQGRMGSQTKTGWRHDTGEKTTAMPVRLARYAGRIAPAAARLAAVSLECRPAVEMVEAYGRHRSNLLYIDPPYDTPRAASYAVDMSGDDHKQLIDAALAATSAVVVSGYAGGQWDQRLSDAGWYRHEITTTTTQGGSGQPRTEVVWSNRITTESTIDSVVIPAHRCPQCTAIVKQPARGRRRTFCSRSCRDAARYRRVMGARS
ncbi:DNA adenine methylase [Gordonia neofelifaecis]|uniref:D12 class N6 adenine-specific DNA methyltransferase n=1 Tax=Gordonia neofelifaecis NRRL B-59395 TaxID=644548 RepID=F1YE57_9ACTN|nr:DNA adenine methylase [Gordonia neofelifaecis]EGD57147.1 D12 class N6 adenine-specific DNA methyltransferase [Gordonia neofelifaecis NRRL B-59395]